MPQPTYKNLKAWTEASDLVAATYSLCAKHKRHIDRELAEQIRSAAVSIPSNIAEGSGRGTHKDALRLLYIARGSLNELETQFDICERTGLIPPDDRLVLLEKTTLVARLIGGLIKYRLRCIHNDTPNDK